LQRLRARTRALLTAIGALSREELAVMVYDRALMEVGWRVRESGTDA
jgi:hypothetical protein